MVGKVEKPKKIPRQIALRALKATAKGVLVYFLYFIFWITFLAPLTFLVPNLQQTLETFLAVYIILMIIGEFTSGTIFQHFFDAAKSLFITGYLLFSLKGGLVSLSYQEISLTIDLSLFLMFAILLSLLGLTKSVLQAINYLTQKTEQVTI
jgi:hypothetical protein